MEQSILLETLYFEVEILYFEVWLKGSVISD